MQLNILCSTSIKLRQEGPQIKKILYNVCDFCLNLSVFKYLKYSFASVVHALWYGIFYVQCICASQGLRMWALVQESAKK
jgi:hypothetical protein